jgi:hypothetical protein
VSPVHDGWSPGEDTSFETSTRRDDFPNVLGMAMLIGAATAVFFAAIMVGLYLMFF